MFKLRNKMILLIVVLLLGISEPVYSQTSGKIGCVDFQHIKKSIASKHNEVEGVVKEIADSEKYVVIIDKTEGGVVYCRKEVDITNRVIQVLKERLLKLTPEELERRYEETKKHLGL